MKLSVYTDGGARGNPGVSGYGLLVVDDKKKPIFQQSKFLGIKTNNEAEYLGLIAALTWLKDHQTGLTAVDFYSDSQLIIRQLTGHYKVKSPNLKPLFTTAKNLIGQIKVPISFLDIRRGKNELADALANQAMDQCR